MALSASHCLLARNALEESEAQLRRLYNNGVRQDALFLALGAVLFLKEDSDSLFALLHGLTIYSETLGYGYLMACTPCCATTSTRRCGTSTCC